MPTPRPIGGYRYELVAKAFRAGATSRAKMKQAMPHLSAAQARTGFKKAVRRGLLPATARLAVRDDDDETQFIGLTSNNGQTGGAPVRADVDNETTVMRKMFEAYDTAPTKSRARIRAYLRSIWADEDSVAEVSEISGAPLV
jgi:hypothetical protein